MRTAGNYRVPAGLAIGIGVLTLSSCVTATRPQQFRAFFLPPQNQQPPANSEESTPDLPRLTTAPYANEMPAITTEIPDIPRPSDADLLLKKSKDRFAVGKAAFDEGRYADARHDFNDALEVLLTAPENAPDRAAIERRLEDLTETIYRYDLDEQAATQPDDQVSYDKSPLDSVLEMTFPVDPSLRNKVLEQIKATVSQLPLEESDAVVGAINFFSTERGRKIIIAGLRRQGRYKDMIERVLREEGLPQELIFVAQAESGFLPRAMSNKSCVGLWQFAKFRGKEYGLDQTPATDDRMDPEKATRAAAHHLHDLYDHFGDWYLALAAYNCGPGCVDHAVMRTGYADFWRLRQLNVLPKETANYVPVILAMTIMAKNAKDYGLDNLEQDPAELADTIALESPTHLALVADAIDRPVSELKDLNPALLRSIAPPGYALHIPKGTRPEVEAAFAIIPPNRRDSWRLHRVQEGETFAMVAKRYKAETASLRSANHEDLPQPGEWMVVPVAYPGDHAARPAAHHVTARRRTPARRKTTAIAHRSSRPQSHSAAGSEE